MLLLPSKGEVLFPFPLNLGSPCDFCRPIEYSRRVFESVVGVALKRPSNFCFHGLGNQLPYQEAQATILNSEGPQEREMPRGGGRGCPMDGQRQWPRYVRPLWIIQPSRAPSYGQLCEY